MDTYGLIRHMLDNIAGYVDALRADTSHPRVYDEVQF